jgi:hypothetical protein
MRAASGAPHIAVRARHHAALTAPQGALFGWRRFCATLQPTDTGTTTSTAKNPSVKVSRNCTMMGSCPARPYTATVLLGAYTFDLKVADPSGALSPAEPVTVTVSNSGPTVASVTPASSPIRHGSGVTMTAAAADPDSHPLAVVWEIVSPTGTAATIAPQGGVTTTVTTAANVFATYTVRATATDPWGQSHAQTGTVAIDQLPTGVSTSAADFRAPRRIPVSSATTRFGSR